MRHNRITAKSGESALIQVPCLPLLGSRSFPFSFSSRGCVGGYRRRRAAVFTGASVLLEEGSMLLPSPPQTPLGTISHAFQERQTFASSQLSRYLIRVTAPVSFPQLLYTTFAKQPCVLLHPKADRVHVGRSELPGKWPHKTKPTLHCSLLTWPVPSTRHEHAHPKARRKLGPV